MKDKIAVLTDVSEYSLFRTVGAEVFFIEKEEEAKQKLQDLVLEYNLIIVTESIAVNLDDMIRQYEKRVYPIILTLPNVNENLGFAIKNLVRVAKQSLGVDVFKEVQ